MDEIEVTGMVTRGYSNKTGVFLDYSRLRAVLMQVGQYLPDMLFRETAKRPAL